MRLTEFWGRMEARFGGAYARSVAADYRLPQFGRTIQEALDSGVPVKQVWLAVCDEFDVPERLR